MASQEGIAEYVSRLGVTYIDAQSEYAVKGFG
jgi:hypothetical protein